MLSKKCQQKKKKKKQKQAGNKTHACVDPKKKVINANGLQLDNWFSDSKNNDQNVSVIDKYNDLVNAAKNEEATFEYLKEKVNELQQQKNILQLKNNNSDRKLHLLKGVKTSYDESTDQMALKLNELKKNTQIKKYEYNQLVEETKKIGKSLEEDLIKKKVIEEEFNEWVNENFDTPTGISQERMQILKKRKEKNSQLKQLLLLINQRNKKNYDENYLKALEKKLNNEIANYKNYKTDNIKVAMKQFNLDLT